MEQEENYRGLEKYKNLLQTICCMDYYYQLNEKEWEGCLGVACVISVVSGITPNIFSISKHLDIPHYDIHLQHAFERLRINGIFSNRFNAINDPALMGHARRNTWQTEADVERNAWCMISGIASGYIGIKENENFS